MAYQYSSFSHLIIIATHFRSYYLLLLTLLLLTNLGWGQCFKPVTTTTTVKSRCMVIGDFNGDGKPDFVAAQSGSDSIAIFLTKEGGFSNINTRFFAGRHADSLAVGDTNADGKLDVVIANGVASVAVLLGDGKGRFSAPTVTKINGYYPALRVLVNDFNTDGYSDVIATGHYDSITVLLNDGHTGFNKEVRYSAGKSTQIRQFKAADFNGDAKPDLILLQDNRSDYFISLLLNNGAGGFNAPTFIRGNVFKNANSAELGDFNGDGKPDLAVAGDSIAVLMNTGTGSFAVTRMMNPNRGPSYNSYVAVGDFNGDDKADLALPGYVLSGKGDGLFADPVSLSVTAGNSYGGFLPGDFNTDGQTDLLAGRSDKASIFLNCTSPLNDSQTATVGIPFAYTVNAFASTQLPNSLTYSASLTPANGLRFDPTTRLISGTPSLSGVTTVTIAATDPVGRRISTSFIITAKPPIILGVDEQETGQLTLSPNPAADLVQVTLTSTYRGIITLRMVSAGGQLVRTLAAVKTGETWHHTLSVQGLPPGNYYLSLRQNDQQKVGKILKL